MRVVRSACQAEIRKMAIQASEFRDVVVAAIKASHLARMAWMTF